MKNQNKTLEVLKQRQAIANEIVDIYKKYSLSLKEIEYVDDEVKRITALNLHMQGLSV